MEPKHQVLGLAACFVGYGHVEALAIVLGRFDMTDLTDLAFSVTIVMMPL
ncbi:hypothetical protein [Sphingomonas sp. 8AM]|nr:hypothetical protein [Sphingomonas sp. 8AM]